MASCNLSESPGTLFPKPLLGFISASDQVPLQDNLQDAKSDLLPVAWLYK